MGTVIEMTSRPRPRRCGTGIIASDGHELSDEEIAAIKPPGGGGKAGAAKKADAAAKKTGAENKSDAK